MPNFSVFNTNPDDLRNLIYGKDGTTSRPLAVNSNAQLLVGGTTITTGTLSAVNGATITAGTLDAISGATITAGTLSAVNGATITAGTLDAISGATITAGTLDAINGATITAGTLSAVNGATITAGTLDAISGATITAGTLSSVTSISQKSFLEISNTGVATGNAYTALAAVTTSVLGVYSYFVYNSGANAADAQIQISADGTNWYQTQEDLAIASGSADVLVPNKFLKYTRIAYRSNVTDNSTDLDIYFNAQGT
jgi:ethanolamine utilization microcompartment shell protein EutS